MSFLAAILVKLALGILTTWLARRDTQQAAIEGYDAQLSKLQLALEADVVDFLLRASRDPHLAVKLRVQSGASSITAVSLDADVADSPTSGNLHDR